MSSLEENIINLLPTLSKEAKDRARIILGKTQKNILPESRENRIEKAKINLLKILQ